MGTRKIITAAIAALILMSWGLLAAPSAGQNPPAPTAGAGTGTIFLEKCNTYWKDERTVSSKIQGRIEKRFVKDGDMVDEDQELAQLDDREARYEFERQDILGKSDLDEQTQYEKLREYQARLDSATRLVRLQAIAVEEWRLAQVNAVVNELLTRKEAEKRKIEQNKAAQADVILKEHLIRSPIRGIVRKCFKRETELVTPSDHQMFSIVATDHVWVEGLAEVSDIYRVRVGQVVEVRLSILEPAKPLRGFSDEKTKPSVSPGLPSVNSKPAYEAEPAREPLVELPQEKIIFPGRIVFIDPNVDSDAQAFRVRAEVENQYDDETHLPVMRAGMKAKMTINVSKPPADESGPKLK